MIVLYRASEANKSPGSISDGSEDKARWNGKKKMKYFVSVGFLFSKT